MNSAPLPISLVVLTFNEERNLPHCLASVRGLFTDVFVVDSGSTDRTTEIAVEHGATVVAHPFERHALQWQWAFEHLPIRTPWVLALDADQRLTPELAASLSARFRAGGEPDVAGYFLNRRQVFRGRWIRYGGYYPKYLLKLFRRDVVELDPSDLVDHHFYVRGRTETLDGDLVEANLKEDSIAEWVTKHNRYARLQAEEEVARRTGGATRPGRLGGNADERTAWMKSVWRALPPYLRPAGYFFYRYVIRLGFLDGKEGFVFHFMQAWWYRLLVDVNLDELKKTR